MGGDPPAPQTSESTDAMLQAYTKNLPQLLQITSEGVLPVERAKLAAQQEISPAIAALTAELYRKYVPQLAETGRQITADDRRAAVDIDAEILKTRGAEIAEASNAISRRLDPEYYKTRELALGNLDRLFKSIPLSGELSGGERAEIERAVAARDSAAGAAGIKSATDTAANASVYGQASEAKLQRQQAMLGDALNKATGVASVSRTGFDPVQAALNRPSSNAGPSQFTGVVPVGDQAFNMGNNFLNQVGAVRMQENDINANRRDGIDRVSQVMGSLPNVSCCFIVMEGINGPLPPYIRYWRDVFYGLNPDAVKGYRKMAKWLVPWMQKSPFVKSLVNELVVYPIASYGYWLSTGEGPGSVYKTRFNFWLKIWNFIGRL